ncbi:MAG: transcription elongation factor subunit Spt4 [Candidatus Aenigmatarchaeota archaeon]
MAKILLACKRCKSLTFENFCPICKNKDLTKNWKGYIYIIDAEKSEVAKKCNINTRGRFALKVV